MSRTMLFATAVLAFADLWASSAGAARTLPAGSYQSSCVQVTLSNGGILSGQCRTRAGRYTPASLNMADCRPGDITNTDGQLTCQPAYGRREDGERKSAARSSGRRRYGPASIVLYDAPGFQGRSLELRGDIDSLDYEHFNDVTSSIRVNGGEWQICPGVQYRGGCVVIRKDVPNLAKFKMSDQLSSLRRIG